MKHKIIDGLVSGNTVIEQLKNKKDIDTVEKQIDDAIEKNDGKKVSSRNIDPKKPSKNEVLNLISEIQNEEIKNALESFQKYLNGEISKAKFMVEIKETNLA